MFSNMVQPSFQLEGWTVAANLLSSMLAIVRDLQPALETERHSPLWEDVVQALPLTRKSNERPRTHPIRTHSKAGSG